MNHTDGAMSSILATQKLAATAMESSKFSLDLVEDVKRIVLEYVRSPRQATAQGFLHWYYVQIRLPSDLQTLCLVSKEWNHVATEILYSNIAVDIQPYKGQLELFEKCLHHGASASLRYTRSLSLYDTTTAHDWVEKYEGLEARRKAELSARQEAILRVLQTIPENRLYTFRYVTSFSTKTQ